MTININRLPKLQSNKPLKLLLDLHQTRLPQLLRIVTLINQYRNDTILDQKVKIALLIDPNDLDLLILGIFISEEFLNGLSDLLILGLLIIVVLTVDDARFLLSNNTANYHKYKFYN